MAFGPVAQRSEQPDLTRRGAGSSPAGATIFELNLNSLHDVDPKPLYLLKIRIKSLAAEARIIRLEEHRAKAKGQSSKLQHLYTHRFGVVRREARASLLAYAYLRGRAYGSVEQNKHAWSWKKVIVKVSRIVGHFGGTTQVAPIYAWFKAATVNEQ